MWIENYNTRRFGWEAVACRAFEVAQVPWSVEGVEFGGSQHPWQCQDFVGTVGGRWQVVMDI